MRGKYQPADAETLKRRLLAKIDQNGPMQPNMDTPCWKWQGAMNAYGVFTCVMPGTTEAKQWRAHRATYTLFVGPIPEDKLLRHLCNNVLCVRPEHLVPGTPLENSADIVAAGRQGSLGARHWAIRNPELRLEGERVGNAKLTDAEARKLFVHYQALKQRNGGKLQRGESFDLAQHYGITTAMVWNIGESKFRASITASQAEIDIVLATLPALKFGPVQVIEIFERHCVAQDCSMTDLARDYSRSSGDIHAILHRTKWAHVDTSMYTLPVKAMPKGECAGNAKITEETVKKVKSMKVAGVNIAQCARALSLSRDIVKGIYHGITWKDVVEAIPEEQD